MAATGAKLPSTIAGLSAVVMRCYASIEDQLWRCISPRISSCVTSTRVDFLEVLKVPLARKHLIKFSWFVKVF